MEDEKNDIAPGIILSKKYRIDKLVGAGGMGAVYEATHTVIGRKVAIKTLHASFIKNEAVLQRFQREAELAGSIGHDNICEVTDFGVTEQGTPYLVMPLLKGHALFEILVEQKILATERLIDIVCQTLSALDAAHKSQIVHRDLKPENIFITRMGDRSDFVKLLDFGISKVLDQDTVLSLTRTGTVLGTPYYMSPEQAKGARDVDHRSDIYATGVILYEALTGHRPFEGNSYNEVMFKIIAEPFLPPSQINKQISPELEAIILKAMEREPSKRYDTALSMQHALLSFSQKSALNKSIPLQAKAGEAPTEFDKRPKATSTPLATELKTKDNVKAVNSRRSPAPLLFGILTVSAAAVFVVGWYVFSGMREQAIPAPIITPTNNGSEPDVNKQQSSKPTETLQAETNTQKDIQKQNSDTDAKESASTEKKSDTPQEKKWHKKKKIDKSTDVAVTPLPTGGNRISEELEKPAQKNEKAKNDKEVEGRFGTKIVSDYDD